MTRAILSALILAVLGLIAVAGAGRPPASGDQPEVASLRQLSEEMKRLRLEVVRQGIEFQEWKVKQLERELQPLLGEQQRLEEQERLIQQRIAELNQQTSEAAKADEVGEEESARTELTEKALKRLQEKRQPADERSAELSEQLKREQQRLRELVQRARQLENGN
jgi:chromosome segregation ATPase